MKHTYAVIMAGGSGTRLWPVSRKKHPKHLLPLLGERTLFQNTVDRLTDLVAPDHILVVTAADQAEELRAQAPQVPPENFVVEPQPRGTASVIGLAATILKRRDPQAMIMFFPSDHYIRNRDVFQLIMRAALQVARQDYLVTLGITPTFPATGYGYIHRGPALASRQGVTIYAATEFREKPDYATAENYVARGDYYWNSGIFLWRAAAILDELKRRKPAMHAAIGQIVDAWNTAAWETVFPQEFATIERISIDYAVMQDAAREGRVIVVHAPFQWDDVGSWLALERHHPQDAHGNTVHGLHCGVDTYNSVIVSDDEHLIATVGVSDLVIVHCPDATLVTTRRHEADVKRLVETLKQRRFDRFL